MDDDDDGCEVLLDDLMSDLGLDLAGGWRVSMGRFESSLFVPELIIVLAVAAVAVAVAVVEEGIDDDDDDDEDRPACMGILEEDTDGPGTTCSWTTLPCDATDDEDDGGFGRGTELVGG